MKNREGFTLVEVVLASMMLGMVLLASFPLIITGRNVISQKQMEAEARMIGSSIFDRVAEELGTAKRVYFGTRADLESDFGEDTSDWGCAGDDWPDHGFDIDIEAEEIERGWLFLSLTMEKDETVLYRQKEVIPLLNVMLFKNLEVEGHEDSAFMGNGEEIQIWYQKTEH